ncbi:hypothetical protein AB1Y20_003060 [Prymnesium parvum]|uniref:Uncharacterized protein n=1 Tax=Prymnesium parvum TaxID=97485 RepID=A0AB34JD70_PRYPA
MGVPRRSTAPPLSQVTRHHSCIFVPAPLSHSPRRLAFMLWSTVRLTCLLGVALGADFGELLLEGERQLQEAGSGASPPPSPTGPPGMPGQVPRIVYAAYVRMVASGNVEDFTSAKKSQMAAAFAAKTGVSASNVVISVSEGSVVVTAKIITASAAAANSATATLNSELSTSAKATSFFSSVEGGVTVASVAPVVSIQESVIDYPPPPPSPPPSSSDLTTPAIVGIAVGTAAVTLLLGGAAVYLSRGSSSSMEEHKSVMLTPSQNNNI